MAAVVLAKRRADSSSAVAPDAPLFAANADGPDLEELLAEEEDRQPSNGTGLNRIRLIAWHTLEDPSSSTAARFISMAMMVVISISVFTFILGSEPVGGCDYDQSFLQANQTELLLPDTPALGKVVIVDPDGDIWSSAGQRICPHSGGLRLGETSQLLVYLEATCVMIFTAELLLRLGSCTLVMPLSKFLLAPLNWVDLAAILPWYVAAITSLAEDDGEATDAKFLSVLRVLRLLRVLRVFKVGRSFSGMLLLLRTVVRSLPVVFILFMLVTICSLLFGTLIHMMESGEFHPADSTHVGLAGHVCADPSVPCGQMLRPDMAPTPFSSIPVSMYWCMVTMSTVGYGDLFPITPMGCVVGALTILAGMMTLALPITIISANFDEETREHNRQFELGRRRTAQLERLAQSFSKHEQRKAECSGTGEGGAHVEAAPMQQRSQRKWSWKGVSVAPAPLADPAAAGGAAAGGAVGMDSKKSSLGASGRNEMSCEKPHSRLGQIGYVTTQIRLPVTSRAVAQEQLKEETEELLKDALETFRNDVNKLLNTLTPAFETSILRVAIQGGLHRKKPRCRDPWPAAAADGGEQRVLGDVPLVPEPVRTSDGPPAPSYIEIIARSDQRAPPEAEAETEEATAEAEVEVVEFAHAVLAGGEGLAAGMDTE